MLGSRVAVEAGPAAYATASTAMPFLYQTRTLRGCSRAIFNPTVPCRPRNTMLRRCFSTCDRVQIVVQRVPSKVRSENERLVIRKLNNEYETDNPYQDRIFIPRQSADGVAEEGRGGTEFMDGNDASLTREVSADNDIFRRPDLIDFDEALDGELATIPDANEIQDLTKQHDARGSTITDTERQAFQKIFSDIFERSNRSDPSFNTEAEDAVSSDGDMFDEPAEWKMESANKVGAKVQLDSILANAMQRKPRTRAQKEEAISRYPPALRAAAAKAIGLVEDEMEVEESRSDRGKALNTQALENMREPERLRVEGLMKAARTDFELMDIMEKEVFSLIPKLGLAFAKTATLDHVPEVPRVKKKKGKKTTKPAEEGEAVATSTGGQAFKPEVNAETETINGVSPLALYGPLYPSYLLLGLRLLDRGFAKPSPFALSILPQIKSLGFISHVLGASTQFYNELLLIYRYRYDNYRGMIDLLHEMEHAALDFDEHTYSIVTDVMRLQASVRRGDKGPTMKALWSMPEFAPNGFRGWRDRITDSLRDKQNPDVSY